MDHNDDGDDMMQQHVNTIVPGANVPGANVPGTICPPLLHSTQTIASNTSPPLPTSTALPPVDISPAATTFRPLMKRYVRPRAKDEQEKHSRLQERKIANRTAAKASRERQKQAMELAQQENDRLKAENNALLERLATLEQRVQTMEESTTQHTRGDRPRKGDTNARQTMQERGEIEATGGWEQTYQPARPMMLDQQCPVRRPPFPLNLGIVVYALQILMHSFALSMVMKTHLERRRGMCMTTRGLRTGSNSHSSPWIRFPGDATLNSLNLSGARGNEVSRRMNGKSVLNPLVVHRIHTAKEFLRRVRRDNNNTIRRRKGERTHIRLIVKKSSSSSSKKRINK